MRPLIECARHIVRDIAKADVRGVRRVAIVALVVLCLYLYTRDVEGMRVHPDAAVDETRALEQKLDRVANDESIIYQPVLEKGIITTSIRDQVTLREFLRNFDADDTHGKSDRAMVVEWIDRIQDVNVRKVATDGASHEVAISAWYDKHMTAEPLAKSIYKALYANLACVSQNYQVNIREYLIRRVGKEEFEKLNDFSKLGDLSYSTMKELAPFVIEKYHPSDYSESELRKRMTNLGDGIYANALKMLLHILATKRRSIGIDPELFEIMPFVDMVYYVMKYKYDTDKSISRLFELIDQWFHTDSLFRGIIMHYNPTRINPRASSYMEIILRRASLPRIARAINEYILEKRLIEQYQKYDGIDPCPIEVDMGGVVNGRNIFMTIVSAYIDTHIDVGEHKYESYYGHHTQPRSRRDERMGVVPSTID